LNYTRNVRRIQYSGRGRGGLQPLAELHALQQSLVTKLLQ